MPWFVKQETFTVAMTTLSPEQRRRHCEDHRAWVESQRSSGLRMASGFLVDGDHKPGGGGLLVFEAPSYAAAEALIQQDPMLLSGGVEWELQEWISSVGDLATDAPSQSFTR